MLRRLESTMTAAGVTTLPEWHELRWRSAREAGYRAKIALSRGRRAGGVA